MPRKNNKQNQEKINQVVEKVSNFVDKANTQEESSSEDEVNIYVKSIKSKNAPQPIEVVVQPQPPTAETKPKTKVVRQSRVKVAQPIISREEEIFKVLEEYKLELRNIKNLNISNKEPIENNVVKAEVKSLIVKPKFELKF